jgi:hypothetical protein
MILNFTIESLLRFYADFSAPYWWRIYQYFYLLVVANGLLLLFLDIH